MMKTFNSLFTRRVSYRIEGVAEPKGQLPPPLTLIRFDKFEEITVLMEKTCNFDSNLVISTQWTLKRPKKLLKAKFFSKAKFEGQRPKNSNFMIFSVIWVSLQTIVQKNSLV